MSHKRLRGVLFSLPDVMRALGNRSELSVEGDSLSRLTVLVGLCDIASFGGTVHRVEYAEEWARARWQGIVQKNGGKMPSFCDSMLYKRYKHETTPATWHVHLPAAAGNPGAEYTTHSLAYPGARTVKPWPVGAFVNRGNASRAALILVVLYTF